MIKCLYLFTVYSLLRSHLKFWVFKTFTCFLYFPLHPLFLLLFLHAPHPLLLLFSSHEDTGFKLAHTPTYLCDLHPHTEGLSVAREVGTI